MASITFGSLNRQLLEQQPDVKALVQEFSTLLHLEAVQAIRQAYTDTDGDDTPGKPNLKRHARHWLDGLPAAKRTALQERAASTDALNATHRRALQTYGLDLESPTPLADQLSPRARAKLQRLGQAASQLESLGVQRRQVASPGTPNASLIFRMNRVRCIEDTTELFKDEIRIGGVATDDEGNTADITNRFIAEFKAGDSKTFDPPKPLTTFNLKELENKYPHSFVVNLAMSEIDNGGFADFIQSMGSTLHYTLFYLGLIGANIGFWMMVSGLIVSGAGIMLAGIFLTAAIVLGHDGNSDVIFPVQSAILELPEETSTFDGNLISPTFTLEYKGFGGHYKFDYSWELVK